MTFTPLAFVRWHHSPSPPYNPSSHSSGVVLPSSPFALFMTVLIKTGILALNSVMPQKLPAQKKN